LAKSSFPGLILYIVLTVCALAQPATIIAIDTTATTPVRPGLSGFNDDEAIPIEYWDYNFNAMVNQLHPGWIRFPGGDDSEGYDWQTGQDPLAWVDLALVPLDYVSPSPMVWRPALQP
jgi:hypothetical protein